MSLLNNLKVKQKLFALVGIAIAGFAVFGAISYISIEKVKIEGHTYNEIVERKDFIADIIPPPLSLQKIQAILVDATAFDNDPSQKTDYSEIAELKTSFEERLDHWKKVNVDDPKLNELLDKSLLPATEYFTIIEKEFDPLMREGNVTEAKALAHGKLDELARQNETAQAELVKYIKESEKDHIEQASKMVSNSVWTTVIVGVVVSVLFMLLGWFIAHMISSPLNDITRKLQAISQGDLDQNVTYSGKDELGLISDSFRSMVEYLSSIRAAANSLAKGDVSVSIQPRSDKDVVAKDMNAAINAMKSLIESFSEVTTECSNGNINIRGDITKFNGAYRSLMDGVNELLDTIGIRIRVVAERVEKLNGLCVHNLGEATKALAVGNLDYEIVTGTPYLEDESKDAIGGLSRSINGIITKTRATIAEFEASRNTIKEVVTNMNGMITEAQNGDIGARVDASKYQGSYAEMLSGMNSLLGAVGSRVKVVADRLEQLRGLCVTNLGRGSEALAKGNLQFEVVTGTEFLHDRTVDAIGELARTVDGIITQTKATVASFEESRAIIRSVTAETLMLTDAANEGNTSVRGNVSAFDGGFRDLVSGINNTLDAFLAPMNEASACLERVANKDLTAFMTSDYKGDFAKMKESLNTALTNLDSGMSQIQMGAEQVTSAAAEISTGSQSLAQGSSEQASTLEEVSSNLQEISSMTRQNASNSKEAQTLSDAARHAADGGMNNMQRLSNAIDRIKESSDATAKIVKTIEEIAFQTNLLALNAAVEAARAGDAGKGFAVVAEEVRNLAMRSAEAAQNTAHLIEEAVRNTDDGVTLNAEVSQNLVEITEQIEKVSMVMAEIAAASEQQNEGVEQINLAVEQMNGVTQQFAANSEESASAAEELTGQSQEILGLIGSFTLISSTGSTRRAEKRMDAFSELRVTGNHRKRSRSTSGKSRSFDSPVVTTTSQSKSSGGASIIPFDDMDGAVLSEF